MRYNFINYLVVLLFFLVHQSECDITYYCCEFDTDDLCNWINVNPNSGEWDWSGYTKPNLTGIDDFNSTVMENYEWGQSDYSDLQVLEKRSPRLTINENDVVSVDVYRQSVTRSTFEVYFIREIDFYKVFLTSELKSGTNTLSVTCGVEIPCCYTYPCNGWFHVMSILESDDLITFTNFVINSCSAPVFPESFCNHLESNSSDWNLTTWKLSIDAQPDWTIAPQFQYSSQYAWAQNNDGAQIISPQVQINGNDTYTFNYNVYISQLDAQNTLFLYILDLDSNSIYPLNVLQSTNSTWVTMNSQCSDSIPCCKVYPCKGQFIWESLHSSGNVLYAVDNLELNDECVNSPYCCGFETATICNMNNVNASDQVKWVWSGDQEPSGDYPTSDGDYMWIKTVGSEPTLAFLDSSTITIQAGSIISFQYYLSTDGDEATLNIEFQNSEKTNLIDYIDVSVAEWATYSITCGVGHAQCCPSGQTECDGVLQFVADIGGYALIEIDGIEIDGKCYA